MGNCLNYNNIELKNLKNTDAQSQYVKDYELDDYFIDALQECEPPLSLTISLYLEEHLPEIPVNLMTSHVYAGLGFYFDKPVPFIIEITKSDDYLMVLSDLQFIDMDEYLDLTNLKLNLKVDERFSYPRLVIDSK